MNVELILVPYDSGQRGWRMGAGPEHLLDTGLAAELERAGHAIRHTTLEAADVWRAEIRTGFGIDTATLCDAIASIVERCRFRLAP